MRETLKRNIKDFFRWFFFIEISCILIYVLRLPYKIQCLILPASILLAFFLCMFMLPQKLIKYIKGINLAVLAAAAVAVPLLSAGLRHTGYRDAGRFNNSVFSNKNVLIIVPHEDDELMLCSGLIEQFVSCGSDVHAAYLTNGDMYRPGAVRINEAVRALTALGVQKENIIFMGYGDRWKTKYKHIYLAPENETVSSAAGFTSTYGTEAFPPYHDSVYTKANMQKDMTDLILEIMPDLILCTDYDSHPDHRCASLTFEHAMAEILRTHPGYHPTVLKGFAYTTAFTAKADFYADNIISTVKQSKKPYMSENSIYLWTDRVRLPVDVKTLSGTLPSSTLYDILKCHKSQKITRLYASIINGDKVFWERSTESLLYGALISASSGSAGYLNDFLLADSDHIDVKKDIPLKNVWIPTDSKKTVTIQLDKPRDISCIYLYDNPSEKDNVLEAEITFSDNSSVRVKDLPKNGSACITEFKMKKNISSFRVKILHAEGSKAGFSEIEAYTQKPVSDLSVTKFIDKDDNFVYDYTTPADGKCSFGIYEYPAGTAADLSAKYTLSASGYSEHVAFSGNSVSVDCPKGKTIQLTLTDQESGEIKDSIYVSNPTAAKRIRNKVLIKYDKLIYSDYHVSFKKYYDELKKKVTKSLSAVF